MALPPQPLGVVDCAVTRPRRLVDGVDHRLVRGGTMLLKAPLVPLCSAAVSVSTRHAALLRVTAIPESGV